MLIVSRIRQKVKRQILPKIPGKLRSLFRFGINTLSLVEYKSLNENARVYGNGQSQKADLIRIYRLVRCSKLNGCFYGLVSNLDKLNYELKISSESIINVDLTEFLPFVVLTLSLQTHLGRSVPVFVGIIKYPVKKERSQNIFIADILRKFLILINQGKSGKPIKPKFVFDRGFMGEYLVSEFNRLGITFYLRVKKSIYLTHVDNHQQVDTLVNYHSMKLRLVKSSSKQQKISKSRQPWYIITNDFSSSRKQIITTYYHRFEIEEWFRDLKHIFQTKATFIKRPQTLLTIIWFQILGTWLLYIFKSPPIIPLFTLHPHHKLSWFRQTFEQLQSELSPTIIRLRFIT
jgi:hypothetical protein